jgi:two-component system, NtrC family, sensor kinase
MTPDELASHAQRFDRLREYVDWSDDDARRIESLRDLVKPEFPRLIDDFYEMIRGEPHAARVITGGEQQVERLKVTLLAWLHELFSGQYDDAYFQRRWRVGWRHVEVGLEQVYADVALSRLRAGLTEVLSSSSRLTPAEKTAAIMSLNKLLDLDLTIIGDAYQAEQIRRQQQLERLLAIGQMAGGVAHELRNPLNVIKTSVYFLKHARSLTPEKLREHLDRVERQVAVADDVITALNDFAKLPVPNFQPTDVRHCVQEVLEECRLNGMIEVTFSSTDDIPPVLADSRQLRIVFGNLIRNARDAMPEGGELEITFRQGENRVAASFRDSGVGISAEHMPRILEPMFSTKARGIGLGLPLARSILDKHDGKLEVTSHPGQGSTFVVWLPAAPNEDSNNISSETT